MIAKTAVKPRYQSPVAYIKCQRRAKDRVPMSTLHQNIQLNREEESIRRLLVDVAKNCDKAQCRTHDADLELRFTGGWVRDKLLGIPCHDLDIGINSMKGFEFATKMNEFIGLHKAEYGLQAATSVHKIMSNPEKSKHLETASTKLHGIELDFVNLRSEEYTEDSRVPSSMKFGSPEEDALRRDATINALFYNLHSGKVEDFTNNGIKDLENKIIRTPLKPFETFRDDPLRVLRLLRFASQFAFRIADDAKDAMLDPVIHAAIRSKISRERIGVEIDKMLKSNHPDIGLGLVDELGLYSCIFCSPTTQAATPPDNCLKTSIQVAKGLLNNQDGYKMHKNLLSHAGEKRKTVWLNASVVPWGLQSAKHGTKKGPFAAVVAYEGLKLPTQDSRNVGNGVIWHEDIIECALHAENLTRSRLGLAVRRWGPSWPMLLTVVILRLIVSVSQSQSSPEGMQTIPDVLQKVNSLVDRILSERLETAYEFKPLLDGTQVSKLLSVPQGPGIRPILESVMEWQLDHPQGSRENCILYLQNR